MFIIGKTANDLEGRITSFIDKDYIILINDYLNNYYESYYKDMMLEYKVDMLNDAKCKLEDTYFDGLGLLPCKHFVTLDFLADNVKSLEEKVNNDKRDLDLVLSKLKLNNLTIKNSNLLDRINVTYGMHVFCKNMNPYIVAVTADDHLFDSVLNNELDLIKDFINDYSSLEDDINVAKENNTFIDHDITNLDLRLQNIAIQNEILNIYKKCEVDEMTTEIINLAINSNYELLKNSLNEGVSTDDIDNCREILEFVLPDNNTSLDEALKKYVTLTTDQVSRYGKVNDKKKVK